MVFDINYYYVNHKLRNLLLSFESDGFIKSKEQFIKLKISSNRKKMNHLLIYLASENLKFVCQPKFKLIFKIFKVKSRKK